MWQTQTCEMNRRESEASAAMGMFDTLHREQGDAGYQTKAFLCEMTDYEVGDKMPTPECAEPLTCYQVEIEPYGSQRHAYATVIAGHLRDVDTYRDKSLSLVDYYGEELTP